MHPLARIHRKFSHENHLWWRPESFEIFRLYVFKNIPPEVFPKIRKFRKNTSVMEQRFKKLARKRNTAEWLLLLSYHCVAYFHLDQVFTWFLIESNSLTVIETCNYLLKLLTFENCIYTVKNSSILQQVLFTVNRSAAV